MVSLGAVRIAPALILVLAIATGCTQDAATTTTEAGDDQDVAATSTQPDAAPAPASACGGDEAFRSAGLVAALGGDDGDARTLSSARVTLEEGCERLTLDFLSSTGAPASLLGPMGVTLIAETATLRITLPPEVRASAIADAAIDSTLVDHLYIVEDDDNGLFVDVHLNPTVPAEASASDTMSPARVVVDLRDSDRGSAVLAPPRRGRDLVVLSPASGPGLYPIQVAGFARPGTDSVRVRLVEEGETSFAELLPIERGTYVWQEFRLLIDDGPSGPVRLVVEAADADGRLTDSISVPLDLP